VIVKANDLGHSYPGKQVFSGLSFHSQPGIGLVLGRNGSGKTTLMRILAGLLAQKKGKVSWEQDGKELDSGALLGLLTLCSPDLSLYHELTLNENVAFFAQLSNIPMPSLDLWGLKKYSQTMFTKLSSGYKQRAKLMIAFMGNPMLLLLDEPEQHLDKDGLELLTSHIEKREYQTIIATNNPWKGWPVLASL
jgi:ABC-type multidrug transport system ATPase subunit